MAHWLTFVVGIIVGLLLGWLLDMVYRRAPRAVNTQALAASTAAPELPGVAAASTIAVATVSDEALDVPPGSETADASEPGNWRELSDRVDALAAETEPPVITAHLASELPEDAGLPPSAVDTLAPTEDDAAKGR